MQHTEATLRKIVSDLLRMDPARISRKSRFADDLRIDSFHSVELVMAFEEAFDIEIEDDDAQRLDTFGAAVDHVHALRTGQGTWARPGPADPCGSEGRQ